MYNENNNPCVNETNTGLQVFANDQFGNVRTQVMDGEPWFVAADVCKALEIGNTAQAISRLDDDEKGLISNDTPGGEQMMSIINEPGLYTLVLGSRKPEAKAFKRWITHDVIPSIRRHGAYMTNDVLEQSIANPEYIIGLLTAMRNERSARATLEEKEKENEPKVLFADSVAASAQSISVGVLAKLMKQNGIKIGQNRLFGLLRSEGYLCSSKGMRKNMPTQRSMEMGLFEIKERVINKPDDTTLITRTTMVTGKGQIYFINHFLAEDTSSQPSPEA